MNSEQCTQERWPNHHQEEDDDEEEEEDALSLSDLPVIQHERSEEKEAVDPVSVPVPAQHDFHFSCSPSKQSQMRPADEIFFQGQIKCLNYPRSQSISSHHSSSSAPRNLFYSHPSPSPRILSDERQFILRNNFVKKSWSWRVFRSGLISAPPEIAFLDLKTRFYGKNSGGGSEKKVRVKTWDVAGGCKCSVEVAFMKRSASEGERRR